MTTRSRTMRTLLPLAGALLAGLGATPAALAAGPTCAPAQDDSWMQPDAVQQVVETMGYTIDGMGISEGNCYEVTGRNTAGESVTTWLDPRTGDVVDEAVAQ